MAFLARLVPSRHPVHGPALRSRAVAVFAAAALAAGVTPAAAATATPATATPASIAARAAVGAPATAPDLGGSLAANPGAPAAELPASSVDTASLLQAYLKARGLPAGSVTGVRPGSVHVAQVAGSSERWATATFRSAPGLAASVDVRLQDGASAGIFVSSASAPWHLVQAGVEPLACDSAVPAAVRSAWNLAPQVSCDAGASVSDASRARAGLDTAHSTAATIASVALSQVGESDIPATTNFGMDCDPYTTMVGPFYPDPDSRGCGYNPRFGIENESEEWCADFAEWVWLRAGISQDMDLINPGANSFYNWGLAQGDSLPIDGTDPQPGDAVVLYSAGPVTTTSGADHVGIVTAVHPDGTIDIVNGDFLGNTNISVQYNTDVNIGPWSSQVEAPGEQWVFVPPPASSPQPASPVARISGPPVVAAGTPVSFSAWAAEPGGSIASYAWAFGDGEYEPDGAATGQNVQHVFADTGLQTVSMIATSNLGTITVRTLNVDVVSSSSAVASTPSDALYYAWTPVAQSLFLTQASGGLAEDNWDGASWLQQALPGDVASGSPLASLLYKGSGDVFEPRVFARSTGGALLEVSAASGTWSTQTLPADPASTSPIVATTVALPPAYSSAAASSSSAPAYPAVFSYDRSGHLTETYNRGGGWTTAVLPAPAADGQGLAVATTFLGPVPVVQVYSVTRQGQLAVTSGLPGGWRAAVIPAGAWPGTSLAAVSTGTGGAAVFFTDAAGHLAVAWSAHGGLTWSVQQISTASVAAGAALLATNFVPASGSPQAEVFAVSQTGQPLLISQAGGSWVTQVLPGTAASLLGLTDYAVPGSPQGVLLRSANGVELDSNATGTWTLTGPLPATPATFADRVLLYGATKADLQSATQAASSAGLPPGAVTGSFATAWDDSLSGGYLVIAVGLAATDGLYFNVCGWANPSDAFPGSTPFNLVNPPLDQLPGVANFEEAAGSTSAKTGQLADDLAYYAVNGQLPPGVSALPAEANVQFTCSGQPSA
jgi:PKD repeat protein